jgi:hypothetical protein
VLPTFQVDGLGQNIFACGDVCNTQEFKIGCVNSLRLLLYRAGIADSVFNRYVALLHAAVVAENIKLLARGGNRSLKTYAPGPAVMLVTIGAKDGVAQLPCCTSKGFLPKKMKSEHLFVQKTRDEFRVPRDSLVPKTW